MSISLNKARNIFFPSIFCAEGDRPPQAINADDSSVEGMPPSLPRPASLPMGLLAQLLSLRQWCGISPDQREKSFKPYFRGDHQPKSVGLGLGLCLWQQIFQAYGDTIRVGSQFGQETTFYCTLPISSKTV